MSIFIEEQLYDIMKLTTEQVEYLKSNKHYQHEGFIRKLFGKILTKKLKKNSDFMKAVDNADKSMEDLKSQIHKAESLGVVIPDELKKYAGLK